LALVVGADPVGGRFKRIALRGWQRSQGRVPFGLGDVEFGGGGGGHPVKALRVFQQRSIAAAAHVGQDAGGGAVDGFVFGGFECQQSGQRGGKIRLAGIEAVDQGGHGVTEKQENASTAALLRTAATAGKTIV